MDSRPAPFSRVRMPATARADVSARLKRCGLRPRVQLRPCARSLPRSSTPAAPSGSCRSSATATLTPPRPSAASRRPARTWRACAAPPAARRCRAGRPRQGCCRRSGWGAGGARRARRRRRWRRPRARRRRRSRARRRRRRARRPRCCVCPGVRLRVQLQQRAWGASGRSGCRVGTCGSCGRPWLTAQAGCGGAPCVSAGPASRLNQQHRLPPWQATCPANRVVSN